MSARTNHFLWFLFFIAVSFFYLRLGYSELPFSDALEVRAPRFLACVCVGLSLALSGWIVQLLLQNPLADPYSLGLSSGASVGSLLTFFIGVGWSQSLGAVAGAFASLLLLLAFVSKKTSPVTVTLWGIVLTLFLTALTVLLLQVLEPMTHYQASRWFMGSLNDVLFEDLIIPGAILVLGSVALLSQAPKLTILSSGRAETQNMGLHYATAFRCFMLLSTLLAAAAVMVAGPIGFVGLISPHLARVMPPRPLHSRDFLIRTFFVGPLLLLLCDLLSRTLLWKYALPTGSLTAALGAPTLGYFLWKQLRHDS